MRLLTLLFFLSSILFANPSLKKVSLQLKWKHQFQFAGFYMAKELGYFESVGLDVEIKEAQDNLDATDQVLNQEATFGISDSVLIYDKINGKDVFLLGAIFQQSPFILLSLKEKGITGIQDLKQKRIMIDYNVRNSISILALLNKNNITKKSIDLLPTTYNVDSLINKEVDVFTSYLSNEPFELEKRGIEYNYIKPSDFGFDFYGDILFTSQEYYKNNPQVVQKFYEATLRGWRYALNNIDITIDTILKKYHREDHSYEKLKYEAEVLKKLSKIDEGKLGVIEKKRIEHIKAVYYLMTDKHNEANYEDFIYDPHLLPQKRETLTVCYSKDMKPYIYAEQGNPQGISAEYFKLIGEKANIDFQFILANNFTEHFEMNKKGICDLVPIIVTSPNSYDFLIPSTSYTHDYLSLVTRIEEPYLPEIGELKDKKIAINSDYKSIIKYLHMTYPKLTFIPMENEDALKALNKGDVYGYIGTYVFLSYEIFTNYHGELKIMRTLDNSKLHGSIGINKRAEFIVERLNRAIEKITTQERATINNSWRNADPDKLIDYSLLYKFLGGVSVLILLFFYKQRILKNMNKDLEKKIAEEVEKSRKKDRMIFQQSKLASMGEMINSIAHQWRNPLSEINAIVMNLDFQLMKSNKKDENLENALQKIENQTKYMSETIENFRNFFKPDKEKQEFLLSTAVNSSLYILQDIFAKKDIKIKAEIYHDKLVSGYLGEFTQVLIIILNNSKDALLTNNIKEKEILIVVNDAITVTDNGGGIKESNLDKIFDPYFTTKDPKQGTGIGLYMSKMIIEESMNGSLEAQNCENGAKFVIKV